MNKCRDFFVYILVFAGIVAFSSPAFSQSDDFGPEPVCSESATDTESDRFDLKAEEATGPVRNAEHLLAKEFVYGPHTLTIKNYSGQDMLIKLEDWNTKKMSRLIFVRNGCTALIGDLRGGYFRMKIRSGFRYSRETKDFAFPIATRRIKEMFEFRIQEIYGMQRPTETVFQSGRITKGNLSTEPIKPVEF